MSESLVEAAIRKYGIEHFVSLLSPEQQTQLRFEWAAWARPNQLAPDGDWSTWLFLAGRGFGKTRLGVEWMRSIAEENPAARIGIIAPTAADARDIVVEGESGVMAKCPPWFYPVYEPSKRRITWPNGAQAAVYSAEEADRLRGPQHHAVLCDELASWDNADEVWDMMQFGLRLGGRPRVLVTTTPRPTDLIKRLVADKTTVITKGSTLDNRANLPKAFLQSIISKYEGTRLGRQEIYAELLDDVEGALWNYGMIEKCRVKVAPELTRIVVAIDPSGSAKKTADTAGIVVAGIGPCMCLGRLDTHAFVLEDLTKRYSPRDMGEVAIAAYHKYHADRLVAEDNFGGKIIEDLVELIGQGRVSYKAVHASRGKIVRAEPVAALYEQGRVHHVGMFKGTDMDPGLEDEMCQYAPLTSTESPGRLDAMVWAITDLMLSHPVTLGEGPITAGSRRVTDSVEDNEDSYQGRW